MPVDMSRSPVRLTTKTISGGQTVEVKVTGTVQIGDDERNEVESGIHGMV
jgi:hypothetical protein